MAETFTCTNETTLPTLEWLEKAASSELEKLATDLFNERYEQVGADKAVFLWAALSLYWVQLTQQLPRNTMTEVGERHTCPVCDAAPVASMIHFGSEQGFDNVDAGVKAESCGDCGSYLKVMYQEKDAYVEPVADDLATILLDAEMEQKEFAKSGLNPFLFP